MTETKKGDKSDPHSSEDLSQLAYSSSPLTYSSSLTLINNYVTSMTEARIGDKSDTHSSEDLSQLSYSSSQLTYSSSLTFINKHVTIMTEARIGLLTNLIIHQQIHHNYVSVRDHDRIHGHII